MKILKITPNLYQIILKQQKDAKDLIRMQIFQEFPPLQNKIFTRQNLKTIIFNQFHISLNKYIKNINGYNLSSDTLDNFRNTKFPKLSKNEKLLLSIVNYFEKPFFIIGLYENSSTEIIIHELCHAFWFLYPEYQQQIETELSKIDKDLLDIIKNIIAENGVYASNVLVDEIQAYLISNPKSWNALLPNKTCEKEISKLVRIFNNYINCLKSKKSLKNPENLLNKFP